jgi:MarR family transcriptional regulator for hemolysin
MPDALHESFTIKLLLLSRFLRREIDVLLEPDGLSEATTLPIRYLAREGRPMRQNELADAMGVEGPTLVRILDQLAIAGYVERVEDHKDRRAKLIHLTAQGNAFHDRLRIKLGQVRDELFARASEDDVRAALRVFGEVEATMRQRRSG